MKTKHNNSFRPLRIANLIKIALDEIFIAGKGLEHNIQDHTVSITNVDVSPDLKLVSCYFIPCVTTKLSVAEILAALNASKRNIRKMISAKVILKYAPEFRFIYDHGFENAMQINKALYLENQKHTVYIDKK